MLLKEVSKKRVAIVGAGISGLAAAKAFATKGHQVFGFERANNFGGVWDPDRSYSDVHTQTSKSLYRFADFSMPADYPEWPKGSQVHDYLMDYGRHFNLLDAFQFASCVEAMQQTDQGWALTIEHKNKRREEVFDFVVICNGRFSTPRILHHEKQDSFKGPILHSSQYNDAQMVKGKSVVVLGAQKSATDICVNAVRDGAKHVHMVYRRNVWRVPYKVMGLINFKHLFFTRFMEAQYAPWTPRGLGKYIMPVLSPISALLFKGVEQILKMQLGLKKHNMVPEKALKASVDCSVAVVTPGFFEGLNAGRITPHIGEVAHYDADQITLTNGETLQADIMLQAVGWAQPFPFFSDADKVKLIDEDGQHHLYRWLVNPDLPNIGFVGANHGFFTMLTSQIGAEWLVRFSDGQLKSMPSAQEMRKEMDVVSSWKKSTRPAAANGGGLCVAPFHHHHIDDLMAQMGCRRSAIQTVKECFTYPRADDWQKNLQSAPHYETK